MTFLGIHCMLVATYVYKCGQTPDHMTSTIPGFGITGLGLREFQDGWVPNGYSMSVC